MSNKNHVAEMKGKKAYLRHKIIKYGEIKNAYLKKIYKRK
jgi:hypothetical protein